MKKTTQKQQPHHRSRRLHLARHHHTGRHMPHGMTSYPALALLVFVSFCFFVGAAASARAATITASDSVTVQGIVPGPAPTTPAVINGIQNGQIFTASPISISGSCEPNTIVKIFRNDAVAGSAFCTSGAFTLQISLVLGENRLRARNYDSLDQAGPESNEITVTYQPPTDFIDSETPEAIDTETSPAPTSATPTVEALTISTDKCELRGLKPRTPFTFSILPQGGTAPYSSTTRWGDLSRNTQKTLTSAEKITVEHSYARAGQYTFVTTVTDNSGQTASLSCTAIVDGYIASPLGTIDTTTDAGDFYSRLEQAMPLYWAATSLLAVGWLLEQGALQNQLGWLSKLARKPLRLR